MSKTKKDNQSVDFLEKIPEDYKKILKPYMEKLPVKVSHIAKAFGLKVYTSDLRFNVSGQISQEDGGYVIRVNRFESRERQRFTIAHELAHFLLHKDLIDNSRDGIKDNVLYRSGQPKRVEYEANRLAADIIMPKNALMQKFSRIGYEISDLAVEVLAAQFDVSEAAMQVRLEMLNKKP